MRIGTASRVLAEDPKKLLGRVLRYVPNGDFSGKVTEVLADRVRLDNKELYVTFVGIRLGFYDAVSSVEAKR